ncbi:hypothetical protein C2845_PM15G17600 [Panicum miliaceum]|uniref:Uncharacterized protein n=1 Tax=Panicum miliaceum TaxID=4540 RepID=A0A3L6QA60_PANMI|nr:hypothetical protein C2845_PM15G17600 [Panicum miliaceum]
MAAVPVYSITRAEIDEFWRRKEVEAEERRLAAEKEAARVMAKTLKMEDYALFEQMMREILKEGNTGDGATAAMVPTAAGGTEARIMGIKHCICLGRLDGLGVVARGPARDASWRSRHASSQRLAHGRGWCQQQAGPRGALAHAASGQARGAVPRAAGGQIPGALRCAAPNARPQAYFLGRRGKFFSWAGSKKLDELDT